MWTKADKQVWAHMTDKARESWLEVNHQRFSAYATCGDDDIEQRHKELEKAITKVQHAYQVTRPDAVHRGDELDTGFMYAVERFEQCLEAHCDVAASITSPEMRWIQPAAMGTGLPFPVRGRITVRILLVDRFRSITKFRRVFRRRWHK